MLRSVICQDWTYPKISRQPLNIVVSVRLNAMALTMKTVLQTKHGAKLFQDIACITKAEVSNALLVQS